MPIKDLMTCVVYLTISIILAISIMNDIGKRNREFQDNSRLWAENCVFDIKERPVQDKCIR